MITRAASGSGLFARALRARGAEPVLAPAIVILPPDDVAPAKRAIAALNSFAWLVFTSSNGVEAFETYGGIAMLGALTNVSLKVAAIGETTARALRERGVSVDLIATRYVAESLAQDLLAATRPADRVLLFRAQEARATLPRALSAAGRNVTDVAAYKTVAAADADYAVTIENADVITFASASAVRAAIAALGSQARARIDRACVACIGPVTARAAREAGMRVDVIATEHTVAGLIRALETHLRPTA